MTQRRLGEILLDWSAITPTQLDRALFAQGGSGRRLGEVLVMLEMVGEDAVLRALAEQLGEPESTSNRRVVPEA